MKLTFLRVIVCCFVFSTVCRTAQAQTSTMSSFRRSFAIVAFAGIGGAVLGLSTLSFYGVPQDHVQNVTTGFLLGLAGGTAYIVSESTRINQRTSSEAYSLLGNQRNSFRKTDVVYFPIVSRDF